MKPYFKGCVKTEWLDDGRNMRLLEDFSFIDSAGHEWKCLKGRIINGANIPVFLRRIRTPFVGKHRIASVIHDVACVERIMPYRDVHRMYKECLFVLGVKPGLATQMGDAVINFGPRWDLDGNSISQPVPSLEQYKQFTKERL